MLTKTNVNYRMVDCSDRRIKPYDHMCLEWSDTFNTWCFIGQIAVDNPYCGTNMIAERRGMIPNPAAKRKLWLAWHRAAGNLYDWPRLILAKDFGEAYKQSMDGCIDDPLMTLEPYELPFAETTESGRDFASRIIEDEFNGSIWSVQHYDAFSSDLELACYLAAVRT